MHTDHLKRLSSGVTVHRDQIEIVLNEFASIGATPRKDQKESLHREARTVKTAAPGTGLDRLGMKFRMKETKTLVGSIVTSDHTSTATDQSSTECHRLHLIQLVDDSETPDLEKAV